LSVTLASYVLLPLAVLLPFLPVRWSITLLLIAASLPNVAVLLLPFFGLQPGYLFSLVLLLASVRSLSGIRPYVFQASLLLLLVFATSVVALAYGFLVPHEDVLVLSGRVGQDINMAERYTPRIENINQYAYFLFNIAFFIVFANRLARLPRDQLCKAITTAVDAALLFVAVVCGIKFILTMLGFSQEVFNKIFYSNPFYGTAYDQAFFGRFNRINGPFLEPSHLGYALSGYLFYYLSRLATGDAVRAPIGIVVCVVLAVASLSTTAFIAAGVAVAVLSAIALRLLVRRSRRFVVLGAAVALSLLALPGVIGLALHTFPQDSDRLLRYILVGKTATESFAVRSDVEALGLKVFVQTTGIGLGLGAHRANSLVVTLLSNIGIMGLVSMGTFLGYLMLTGPAGRASGDRTERHVASFLLGLILTHLISNPNFGEQYLWLTATLLGALRASRSAVALPTAALGKAIRAPAVPAR
jgi:hypothetical protein